MGFLTTETPLSVTLFNLNATNAAYIYRVRLMRRLKNVHVLRETGNFPVCAKKKKRLRATVVFNRTRRSCSKPLILRKRHLHTLTFKWILLFSGAKCLLQLFTTLMRETQSVGGARAYAEGENKYFYVKCLLKHHP